MFCFLYLKLNENDKLTKAIKEYQDAVNAEEPLNITQDLVLKQHRAEYKMKTIG